MSKGPHFALAPNNPPNVEFISAIELACQKLKEQDIQELRAEVNIMLRRARSPKSNVSREEKKALKELREDQDSMVLTADKGVALVTPLRPIVSSRGSVTYGVAKVIAKILKPLVGKLPHHIQSTSDFVNKVREITLLPGECLMSCDATTLFTSVPIDPALNIIKDLLEKDDNLSNRTVLSVQNIKLLGFCVHNLYFYENKFSE